MLNKRRGCFVTSPSKFEDIDTTLPWLSFIKDELVFSALKFESLVRVVFVLSVKSERLDLFLSPLLLKSFNVHVAIIAIKSLKL